MDIFGDSSQLDQRSASMLVKAIEDHNLDGFDYLEFKQSLTGLSSIHTDEATRFQSAYVTASTLGLTKNKLVETAGYYKKVIEKEKLNFDKAAQNQIQKGIGNKRQKLEQYQSVIKQKRAQIQKLEEEIATYEQEVGKLTEELSGAETKIANAQTSFHNACQIIVQHINEDINKINMYIA